jgi:hypothetical protein
MAGERIEDADFGAKHLHGPNFEGTRITDGWFLNADFSGDISGLVINGVEIEPLVSAELDRRFPFRVRLRSTDPDGLAGAWSAIEEMWAATVQRAKALPPSALTERVDHEWSFVETQRHLVMATDCWLRRTVKGMPQAYHPWGLAGFPLSDPRAMGLDPDADPSLDDVLAVRREHMDEVAQTIAALSPGELDRVCTPPSTPGHPNHPETVLHCLHVILNEEWEHHQYAVRDLAVLEARLS